MAKNRNSAQSVADREDQLSEEAHAALEGADAAEATLQAQAEADVKPEETARERLARLEAETKAARAEAQKEAREEKAAKVSGVVNAVILPALKSLVNEVEATTGLTLRNLVVRFAQPGDDYPAVVEKLEQGKPGIIVKHRLVKARQKDAPAQATLSEDSAQSE